MNYNIAIRQGDLLFVQFDKKLDSCELVNTLVISDGESNGHKHQVISGTAKFYKAPKHIVYAGLSSLLGYLEVTDKAVIGHEEHLPVILNKGIYVVLQQRIYNPFDNEVLYGHD